MFKVFDYPRQIQKIKITEESVDQATGEITSASKGAPVPIIGHISDLTQQELALMDAALVEQGVRKFATSDVVVLGDVIRITEAGLSTADGKEFLTADGKEFLTTDWIVEKLMYEGALIQKYTGDVRKTYLLKRL